MTKRDKREINEKSLQVLNVTTADQVYNQENFFNFKNLNSVTYVAVGSLDFMAY